MIEPRRKYYFGNYPNSYDYDDRTPIGWNKWDAEDTIEFDEPEEETELDNEIENDAD